MYVVHSQVRRLAKQNGKRIGKSYFEYLERRVHSIVMNHIGAASGKTTLRGEDAEVLDAYRMTRA